MVMDGTRSLQTRQKMLEAAERLFSAQGIDAVNLRDIGRQAGQRNNSAVQYHFGTKDQLVRDLIEMRLPAIVNRRSSMLDDLVRDSSTNDFRRLAESLVGPFAEASVELPYVNGFLSSMLMSPRWAAVLYEDERFAGGQRLFAAHLASALGEIGPESVKLRVDYATQLTVHALGSRSRTEPPGAGMPLDACVRELIEAVAGLMRGTRQF